jgi:hypothetical protein
MGEIRKLKNNESENPKVKDHLGEVGADNRIILRRILKKQ